jgi:hypothetical protein
MIFYKYIDTNLVNCAYERFPRGVIIHRSIFSAFLSFSKGSHRVTMLKDSNQFDNMMRYGDFQNHHLSTILVLSSAMIFKANV